MRAFELAVLVASFLVAFTRGQVPNVITMPQLAPAPRVNPAHRPNAPGFPQPAGPAPYQPVFVYQHAMVLCSNGEFFDPRIQLCCHGSVHPLIGPPEFAVCCNGEVIDNRTTKCCQGTEPAFFGQACCGPEAYDLGSEEHCCADRYLYDVGVDMCCNDYLSPAAHHICCLHGPVRVLQPAAQATCCGCGAIDAAAEMCCGGVAVRRDSTSQACCAGQNVYDPSAAVCCKAESGVMRVTEGQTCPGSNQHYGAAPKKQMPYGSPPLPGRR